jgi:hypothetical protein
MSIQDRVATGRLPVSRNIGSSRTAVGAPLAALLLVLLLVSSGRAQFVYTMDYVDSCIFQQDRSPDAARKRLDSHLTVQLDEIDRVCKLSEVQKRKLRLAGGGDIKHFFDKYEKIRRNFKPINQEQPDFQDAWQKLWQEVSPLQASLQNGVFEEESLFSKSVRNTLTAPQRTGYETLDAERRQFNWRATILQTVETLDQSVRLTKEQRKLLIDLLTRETKPPRRTTQTYYDQYYLYWQLDRIPHEKYEPKFDAIQWRFLNTHLTQARNVAQNLRRNKLWPGDEAADEEDKPAVARPAVPKKK